MKTTSNEVQKHLTRKIGTNFGVNKNTKNMMVDISSITDYAEKSRKRATLEKIKTAVGDATGKKGSRTLNVRNVKTVDTGVKKVVTAKLRVPKATPIKIGKWNPKKIKFTISGAKPGNFQKASAKSQKALNRKK